MVLSYAMALAGMGVVAGVVAAVVLTRFIAGMLFGVSPTDPCTFGVIALTLGLTPRSWRPDPRPPRGAR